MTILQGVWSWTWHTDDLVTKCQITCVAQDVWTLDSQQRFSAAQAAGKFDASMRQLKLSRAFTLIEPGPVVLVTTCDGNKNNVMTISWTMVLDFTPMFAITTGEWNHSFAALRKTRECVIAIPTVDLLDRVIGIGTCSGADTDKFAKFNLTAMPGKAVNAPMIKECVANIECKVVDLVHKHNIVVLEAIAAYVDPLRKEKRTIHAVGDGTFIVDGRKLDRRKMMASKLPEGI
jgi:flavin reductase (DIM6/NTAB) family NADH-FMN oxidoreductase RutF